MIHVQVASGRQDVAEVIVYTKTYKVLLDELL